MHRIALLLLTGIIFTLIAVCPVLADVVLEPFSYSQDFETVELSAWASYPLWQDTAYDPNMRVNTIVPGDPNISVVQTVTPYTNVDNYAGAQKELDMYLAPGDEISLRFFLKTQLVPEYCKIRIAAGADGKADVTFHTPDTNKWVTVTVSYDDFIRENTRLAGKKQIKVNALAVLAKFPDADPSMPIFFGLDNVEINASRAMAFRFSEPAVDKLSEWKPYIPKQHYLKGDTLTVTGEWPLGAKKVICDAVLFTDHSQKAFTANLKKKKGAWTLSKTLDLEPGLYLGTLKAMKGKEQLSDTQFTFYIAPEGIGKQHPRIWFDKSEKASIDSRMKSDRFKDVYDDILKKAESSRKNVPVDEQTFDIDQFPDEKWIATLTGWSSARIGAWRRAIHQNALAYAFHGDKEAGVYAKDLFLKISDFPYWLHPWMTKRGRHIYYPVGEMGIDLAIGYDLIYDLMTESEREKVRAAMWKNIVLGCHEGYVEDDLVTNNTSNWVAHITGGSLMCLAAMYGDGDDVAAVEPYLTGAIMKNHELVQNTLDKDGAYGEGYGYYNFSMLSWSKSIPVMDRLFNIDMSAKLNGSYKEIIWAGPVKEKYTYYFGDSSGGLRPLTNWAWLLPKYNDPMLGWFYNHMKTGETFMDVIYETEQVAKDDPFDEEPVKLFREVGTTVFKSGWEADDFIFVMRTGPFINHQHIDQGTFWLSYGGSRFIEERHGSTYYNDPNYQSWYTQPVGHSTILIDGNQNGQRVGDVAAHVDGFDDYAYMTHFLNGESAAFSSGDIGRLYWDKVKGMQRNVLYLKPNTVIMVDTIEPAERDVDVTLLYQAGHLDDITAAQDVSKITKNGNTLAIHHAWPLKPKVSAVETPHYLYTLQRERPLKKEGMLTVTGRTAGNPLVIANVLTAYGENETSIDIQRGDGFVYGTVDGVQFTINTKPGFRYDLQGVATTDALVATGDADIVFMAMGTMFEMDGELKIESEKTITCEISYGKVSYYLCSESTVFIGMPDKPSSLKINGEAVTKFSYDEKRQGIVLTLPAGEGLVSY